jgi:hypothetical protein
MRKLHRFFCCLFAAMLVGSLLLAACGPASPTATGAAIPTPAEGPATSTEAPAQPTPPPPTPTEVSVLEPTPAGVASTSLVFAAYVEPAVRAVPALEQEPIAADLGNVRVGFPLSASQRERLAQDGFAVSPGVEKEFFTVYEKSRYANVPIFVSSDSLLHVYHLLFDKVLRTAERSYFIPLLRDLNAALLERTGAQYQALEGTAWEDAARRTVAFAGVGSKLLDPSVQVPDYASELVDDELALIDGAAGTLPSPIFPGLPYGEDYTQYIPRGHYTLTDSLKAYFKSMMWYGRMTFRLKTDDPEVGRAETRSALLLVQALRTAQAGGRPAVDAWTDLYNPTVFFVGRSDDLTALQYAAEIDAVYGAGAPVTTLADDAKLDQFIEAANKLPPPRILGIVIADTQDVEQTTKGLRFMGQRFVPDAYIFRQLIYRNVGTPDIRRGLPKGLDLLAAMGSERAHAILDEEGDTAYENYPQQMAKVQTWVTGLSTADWTETLYNTWLYTFQPLLSVPGQGNPAFMQSPAWVDKQLHTALGSWAELKHDTILYAKQVYAEMGEGGGPPEPVKPKNYVEPVPEFYARLTALTAMTREGLGSRGMLADDDSASLQRLEELSRAFQAMAEKELRGEPLAEEEESIIRFYGGDLEHLTMAAAFNPQAEEEGPGGHTYMEEEPQAAVIADVATDPDPGIVLEEAVGRVDEIHVVVPVVDADGTTFLQVAKGAVFSYYEFPWPSSDRLTDEKWRKMLDDGKAPSRPEWTASFFTTEGESSDLATAVFGFQQSLVQVVWYLEGAYLPAKGAAQDLITAQLDALRAAKQYEGHALLRSDFRSFDRQSVDKAVVTVREWWQDSLYPFTDYAGYGTETPVGHRGPYTLDVTYTLERDENAQWSVTNIVYANQPPNW